MLEPAAAPRRALVSTAGLAVLLLLLLALAVIGERTQPEKSSSAAVLDRPTPTEVAVPPFIPEPVEPVPAGTPVPVAGLAPVEGPEPVSAFPPLAVTARASVVVDVPADEEPAVRALLATRDGVVAVAAITAAEVDVGGVRAEVAAVDPVDFRPLTPEATANHAPLWDRIAAGDLAVTHEFGLDHDVPLGQDLAVGPDGTPVRVGALATNGTPPIADAILSTDRMAVLGPDRRTRLLVGLAPEASPTATAEALTDAGFPAQEIPDPRLPTTEVVIPEGGITPENVWDHLALCESSGDWHINTGNGYYGGVQFLPESWAAVGGTGLPHEHTREEQIYRATLLWQIQGWEAWPQCARKLGLIVDRPPSELPAPPSEGGQG